MRRSQDGRTELARAGHTMRRLRLAIGATDDRRERASRSIEATLRLVQLPVLRPDGSSHAARSTCALDVTSAATSQWRRR